MTNRIMFKGLYSGKVIRTISTESHCATLTYYDQNEHNSLPHEHENVHFSFMVNGGCVERKKSDYEIHPGSVIYYPAGQEHQVTKVAKNSMRVNLELESSFFKKYNFSNEHIRKSVLTNPDTKFLLMKIYDELQLSDTFSNLSIEMLFLQLMTPKIYHTKEINSPVWLNDLEEYLRSRVEERITLEELSLICNLHSVTISKQFPKYFNCTIGNYRRKLMIEKALPLILSSNLSLGEIAYECGFFDQSHFIRTFKGLIGNTPNRYRKLYDLFFEGD